jgi:hypothetical protein
MQEMHVLDSHDDHPLPPPHMHRPVRPREAPNTTQYKQNRFTELDRHSSLLQPWPTQQQTANRRSPLITALLEAAACCVPGLGAELCLQPVTAVLHYTHHHHDVLVATALHPALRLQLLAVVLSHSRRNC